MKTITKNDLTKINGGGCLVESHLFIINRPVIIFDPLPPVGPVTPAPENPLLPLTKLKAIQLGGVTI